MANANTANTNKISLVVSEQLPEFVRAKHPKFITFLEKYYAFMEQPTAVSDMAGPLYASKKLVDYRDPDYTDFELFLESTRKEFSPTLPSKITDSGINRRTLYKRLLDFYHTKGSEDSFKFLFRVIYGEDVELYYPKVDLLLASGGNWIAEKKMFITAPANSAIMENRKITGESSGATAVVERAVAHPAPPFAANSSLYDPEYLSSKEVHKTTLYLNTDSMLGTFQIHENIFTGSADGKANVVAKILPIVSNTVFFDDFSTYPNSMFFISPDDNRGPLSNASFNVPWGPGGNTVNLASHPIPIYLTGVGNSTLGGVSNTGFWFNYQGNGVIQFVAEDNVSGGRVLQIGNNFAPDSSWIASGEDWDSVDLIHTQNIPYDPTKLYRMTVRARDYAKSGNTSSIVYPDGDWYDTGSEGLRASRNRWGIQGIQKNKISLAGHAARYFPAQNKVVAFSNSTTNKDTLSYSQHDLLVNGIPLSPEWFVYETHIQGKVPQGIQTTANGSGGFDTNATFGAIGDYGGSSATRTYYSVDSPVELNYYVDYIRPRIETNINGGADITQIDYVKIEELSAIADAGEFIGETGLLSTKSAYIQDNTYRHDYAYEIKSEKELAEYQGFVKESVHPVGTEMFGNKLQNSFLNTSYLLNDVRPGDRINITNTPTTSYTGMERGPAWSPDGTQIAFYYGGSNDPDGIHIMNADGSGITQITTGNDSFPGWKPTGDQLTFTRHDGSNYNVYKVNPDGTSVTELTDDSGVDWMSSWETTGLTGFGPMGQTGIVFVSTRSGNYEIYTVSSGPSTIVENLIYSDGGTIQNPRYSPDGERIVFNSDAGGTGHEIYTIDKNGTDLKRLTNKEGPISSGNYGDNHSPVWSPDGNYIAFVSERESYPTAGNKLFIMDSDGLNQTLFSDGNRHGQEGDSAIYGLDWHNSLSQGNRIVYAADRSGQDEIGGRAQNIIILELFSRISTNMEDSFSPDQLDSLASWWKADAITADNLDFGVNVPGINDTKNLFKVGYSNWEVNSLPTLFSQNATISLDNDSFLFGNTSLKAVVTGGSSGSPAYGYAYITGNPYINSGTNLIAANQSYFQTAITANTKWLFSAYWKTDNNDYVQATGSNHLPGNTGELYVATGNNYGGRGYPSAVFQFPITKMQANNTWERVQGIIDLSGIDDTKLAIRLDFNGSIETGVDITHYVDGIQLEHYDSSVHGLYGNATHDSSDVRYRPTSYALPGMNGANVMSWNDSSINEHHLYSNTHGTDGNNPSSAYMAGDDDLYFVRPPLYLANAVNGHPAIHFQGPTVNAQSWSVDTHHGMSGADVGGGRRGLQANTYRWSPQRRDSVSSILMANTHLGNSNALARPVANSWSVFVVCKGSLHANSLNYTSNLQLISSGAGKVGNPTAGGSGGIDLSIGLTAFTRNGSLVTQAKSTASGGFINIEPKANVAFEGNQIANTNEWNIFGYSEYAHNGASTTVPTEAINFHINGLLVSNTNSRLDFGSAWGVSESDNTWYNLTKDGLNEAESDSLVTSVGGARRMDYTSFYGDAYNPYDGQIAEILVFNKKLANNQIAKIEGYLAHKYGLTDKLNQRDNTGTHPYKTALPPEIGD